MKLKKIILTFITIGLGISLSGCWQTSVGEKTGIIVKLAKEGAFWSTNESELIRGGLNSGSGVFGKPFYFTIPNNEMAKQLNDAMEKQLQVRIHYHTEAICAPWRGESNCTFLDSFSVDKN